MFCGKYSVNHLLHADDLCCFSPSLDALQGLLYVCSQYAVEHDIRVQN